MTPADASHAVAEALAAFEDSVRLFPGSDRPIFGYDELTRLLLAVRAHERACMEAKWLPPEGRPLSNADFLAIKMRWGTGPEKYQADADALICALIDARSAVERERAEIADCIHVVAEARREKSWQEKNCLEAGTLQDEAAGLGEAVGLVLARSR